MPRDFIHLSSSPKLIFYEFNVTFDALYRLAVFPSYGISEVVSFAN